MKSFSPPSLLAVLSSMLLLTSGSALSSKVAASTKAANPVIKAAANGMTLLKPIFAAEAKLQASVLGNSVVQQEVSQEIDSEVKSSPVVIYTYGLSPFSTEAVSILESTECNYNKIELGAEWFLRNGKDSVKR
ncbi:MAG: hypothetical protein SGILL_010601, partial [Bacillariaceae sp.]